MQRVRKYGLAKNKKTAKLEIVIVKKYITITLVLVYKGVSIMLLGTVKWFNTKKGYGFIAPEKGEKDVFVHVTQLEKIGLRRLSDGQRVGYELYDDRGRIAAGNIKVL